MEEEADGSQFVTSAAPFSERPDVELKSTYVKSHLTSGKERAIRRSAAAIGNIFDLNLDTG